MSEIGIFYGSFTGTTEDVARRIATKVGVPEEEVREVSQLTDELVSDYNVLIFGTATWGSGEAHDDWYDGLGKLRKSDLSDKKAMATLANLYTIIGL